MPQWRHLVDKMSSAGPLDERQEFQSQLFWLDSLKGAGSFSLQVAPHIVCCLIFLLLIIKLNYLSKTYILSNVYYLSGLSYSAECYNVLQKKTRPISNCMYFIYNLY